MMEQKNVLKFILVFVMVFTIVLGLGSAAPSTAAAAKEILIGVSTGLTGAFAVDGEKVRQGVNMALDEINAKGGVLGKKMKAVFEDDQNNPATAVNTVNKLVSEGVVAMVGPTLSSTVMATEQIVKRAGIPLLTGGTNPKLVNLGNPYIFRIRASDTIMAKLAAKYATVNLKAKKVGMCYNNDEFGTGGRDVIDAYLKSIRVPFVSEGHNTGDKDMTGQLIKLKNAQIDVLIIWTHDQEMAILGRQMKELNINIPVVCGPGITTNQVLNLVEKEWVEGWFSVTDIVPTDPLSRVQNFEKRFQAKYKVPAELYAAAYYGGVIVLADAIKRAKSADGDKIRDSLLRTKNILGAIGTYYSNEKGELMHEASIAVIKNKTPQILDHVKE